MTTPYNTQMFESIRGALAKTDSKFGERLKDYLRTEPGNTYVVRLLPNVKDPKKTFYHYYNFGWKSFSTGQRITVTSLQTWDQPDPIAEERYRVYNTGTQAEKDKIKAIRRSENWIVNAYVISDSKTPENNGTVKILRFGKQLGKIIFDAIEGDSADDYGPRVFDLSAEGCSLMIKVEEQGDYPTYVSSKFKSPKAIDGMTPEQADKIYQSAFDLTPYVTSKSYAELKAALDTHYHSGPSAAVTGPTAPAAVGETPMSTTAPTTPAAVPDDEIKRLLSELDN